VQHQQGKNDIMNTTGANQPYDDNASTDEASRRQRRRRIRVAAVGVPSAAALAAIGFLAASGGGTSSAASKPPPAASSTLAGTVIHTTQSSSLGTVLADGRGMTLYTLTNNGQAVSCTGPCATIWPPVISAPGTTPSAAGVAAIGTAASPTGDQLFAHNGLPLYRFSGDTPGSTSGEGMDTFGGVWHVATVGAGATAAPGSAHLGNATTTPKPAAGGYGY
jgi:predicted lipoprotein with Yx(FWY)xxD motif